MLPEWQAAKERCESQPENTSQWMKNIQGNSLQLSRCLWAADHGVGSLFFEPFPPCGAGFLPAVESSLPLLGGRQLPCQSIDAPVEDVGK